MSTGTAQAIRSGLRGDEIPLNAQIALLSQVVDVFATAQGPRAAGAPKWSVVPAAGSIPSWSRCSSRFRAGPISGQCGVRRISRVGCFRLEPALVSAKVDDGYLDDITLAFASIIDSKSPYTSGHSERVTTFTDLIAAELGTSEPRRRWLRRGALLHDVGKLGVSSTILDKPGKLDEAEWASIRMHPVYTAAGPVAGRRVR